jgi:hypothetical protein
VDRDRAATELNSDPVAERSFAGVFPTHHGQACIWVCTPSADAKAARRRTGSRVEAFGEETAALARYQRQRDHALRGIFEITCRLGAYPAVPAFIALQKQLSAAIDSEAAALASRPVPGERLLATA